MHLDSLAGGWFFQARLRFPGADSYFYYHAHYYLCVQGGARGVLFPWPAPFYILPWSFIFYLQFTGRLV